VAFDIIEVDYLRFSLLFACIDHVLDVQILVGDAFLFSDCDIEVVLEFGSVHFFEAFVFGVEERKQKDPVGVERVVLD